MNTDTTVKPPKRWLRRILKGLGYTAAAVVVLLIASHFIWKYSGSNTWESELEKDGVKIYSLKAPGSTLKKFRAVTRVKTTLNRAVAAMASTDTEDCAEWAPGCTSEKAIKPWSPREMTYTHLYRLTFPSPFTPREFLIRAQITQDVPSKSVLVDFQAAPDALPRNSCCIRVEDLHNTWRFTPVGNGEVEVEASIDADQQLPYVMVNRLMPHGLYLLCTDLQKFLDKEKWRNARFERIEEM